MFRAPTPIQTSLPKAGVIDARDPLARVDLGVRAVLLAVAEAKAAERDRAEVDARTTLRAPKYP